MRASFLIPACVLLVACPAVARADPTEPEKAWLERVLLGTNPASPGVYCVRWVKKTPTVSAFGAKLGQAKAVEDAVESLNLVLDTTPIKKLELAKPDDKEADIKVHFAAEKEFANLGKKYDFKAEKGKKTYAYVFWNARRELTSGIVLIPSDSRGDELKHYVLREMTRALGFQGKSPEYADSIFYEKDKASTSAADLNRRDRKLVNFLYNHIEPGMKLKEVQAQYKHW
ncbi:MAG: DUF2927 domain-containing protein [Gemmataceae bacterium]